VGQGLVPQVLALVSEPEIGRRDVERGVHTTP
jgi:hypothetical protein